MLRCKPSRSFTNSTNLTIGRKCDEKNILSFLTAENQEFAFLNSLARKAHLAQLAHDLLSSTAT